MWIWKGGETGGVLEALGKEERQYCMKYCQNILYEKKTNFNKRKTEREEILSKLSAGQGSFLPVDLALSQPWAEELLKVVGVVNTETDSWSNGQK